MALTHFLSRSFQIVASPSYDLLQVCNSNFIQGAIKWLQKTLRGITFPFPKASFWALGAPPTDCELSTLGQDCTAILSPPSWCSRHTHKARRQAQKCPTLLSPPGHAEPRCNMPTSRSPLCLCHQVLKSLQWSLTPCELLRRRKVRWLQLPNRKLVQ